jgi:lytic murein transglycosylase
MTTAGFCARNAAGTIIVWMACCLAPVGAAASPSFSRMSPAEAFQHFVARLWWDAEERHVSRATFDMAFDGVKVDPAVVKRTHAGQAEFVQPIWTYLANNVSAGRIAAGKSNAVKWRNVLARAEPAFGVDQAILLAVWGMESGYGAFTGDLGTIRTLATLTFTDYRDGYFRTELLDALEILQAKDVTLSRMRGSWAGAMGQTQFMPSSFKTYAIDFDGDGRRDIWTSVPDALGSTAHFLQGKGWIAGQPWGFEVILPDGFDLTRHDALPFDQWSARGVRRTWGASMPTTGTAAGQRGPAFLVTPNFLAIKAYNLSTSYALGVGLLADRIAGRPPLVAGWPTKEHVLTGAQTRDLQTRLKILGYDVGAIDGMIGERARDAIVRYQAKVHFVPDGFPTLALLQRLRSAP